MASQQGFDWTSLILSKSKNKDYFTNVIDAVNSHYLDSRPDTNDWKQLLSEIGRISSVLICGYIKMFESSLSLIRPFPMELIDVILQYFIVDRVTKEKFTDTQWTEMYAVRNLAIECGYIPLIALMSTKKSRSSSQGKNLAINERVWSRRALQSAHRSGHTLSVCLMIRMGVKDGLPNDLLPKLYEEGNYAIILALLSRWKAKIYTSWRFYDFLNWACEQNKVDLVRQLVIDDVMDINMEIPKRRYNTTRRTPLWIAWQANNDEMLEMMIAEGSDIDFRVQMTNYGVRKKRDANTSVVETHKMRDKKERAMIRRICSIWSTHPDSMQMIRCWLKCKIDVGKLDIADRQTGRSALMNAIELLGIDAALEMLKDPTIDIEHRDKNGGTALFVAVQNANGDMRLIQRLLELNANVNVVDNKNCTLLFHAVQTGVDAVNLLLSSGADPDTLTGSNRTTLLFQAASSGNIEIVEVFLKGGADPDAPSGVNVTTPLFEAASFGNGDIVETLLKAGADSTRIDDNGDNIWTAAVKSGDVNTVKIVYEYLEEYKNGQNASFVDPRDGWMALHFACSAGYVDVVKYLLDVVNVDVNLVDSDGMTPLMMAVDHNAVETVKVLIEHQADPTIPNKKGRIAAKGVLEIALQCGDLDVLQCLYQYLISRWTAEKVDEFMNGIHFKKGQTALHLASSRGHTNVCEYLAQSVGVNVNAPDLNGKTPLDLAVAIKCQEIIELLSDQQMDSIPLHQENALEIRDDVKEDEYRGKKGVDPDPFFGDNLFPKHINWTSLILSDCNDREYIENVRNALNIYFGDSRPDPGNTKELFAECRRISSLLLCGYMRNPASSLSLTCPLSMKVIEIMLQYFFIDYENAKAQYIPQILMGYGYISLIALMSMKETKSLIALMSMKERKKWKWTGKKLVPVLEVAMEEREWLRSAFQFACQRGHTLTACFLIRIGEKIPDKSIELFEKGNYAVISALLSRWKSRNNWWEFSEFLDWAFKLDKVDLVRQLVVDNVVDINMEIRHHVTDSTTQTPLWIAWQAKNDKMLEMMITEGSDVDFLTKITNYGKRKKEAANISAIALDKTPVQKAIFKPICKKLEVDSDAMNVIQYWLKCKVCDWTSSRRDLWRCGYFLDWACKQNKVDLVRQLMIDRVVDINMKIPSDPNKRYFGVPTRTPLWIAWQARNKKMLEMMITEGSDIDFKIQMTRCGKREKRDANTSVVETDKMRDQKEMIIKRICLTSRIHPDSMEMIQCWLKCKIDVSKLDIADRQTGRSALMNAIELLGIGAALEMLKDPNIDIDHRDENGETALFVAVQNANGDMRLIQRLLELNANMNVVDNKNCTLLFHAVQTGLDAVNLLLSSGADPNRIDDNGDNIWKAAVKSGNVNRVKVVYESLEEYKNGQSQSFVDPRDEWMALHFACSAGYVDVVKYLLDVVNVDVNLVDSDGMTPLMMAADYNAVGIVKVLIEHQADPTIPDKKGRIAAKDILEIAVQCGDLDVLQCLYQYLVSRWTAERVDGFMNGKHFEKEQTALHLACSRRHTNVCEYLVQSVGVNVNVSNLNGKTPLDLAVATNCEEIIELLSDQQMDTIPVHQENALEIRDDVKEDEDDENDSTLSPVYKRPQDDTSIPPHHVKSSDQ